MNPHRRAFLGTGLGLGLGVGAAATVPAAAHAGARSSGSITAAGRPASDFGVVANTTRDQTAKLQAALDETTKAGQPLWLAPGRYHVTTLRLGAGATFAGAPGKTALVRYSDGPLIVARGGGGIRLDGIRLEGFSSAAKARSFALIEATDVGDLILNDVGLSLSAGDGIRLTGCGGRITSCTIQNIAGAGLFSTGARGLDIAHNRVSDCADNGILVWQAAPAEDGTLITANRIERIGARSGGSGQYGNGINVYRANNVIAAQNRIVDCTYSAVRGNAASNIQIAGNSCSRLGEVAIYAEFGFQGAVIANNVIDHAATGIAVTNFDHGGRLAVVEGNLVRDLFRREFEPVDKRGDGITVEADAAVTGNVIENAPHIGLVIGWGPYMRDVAATSNVIRNAGVGIGITRDSAAARALIAQNLISGAKHGAIRAFDHARPVGPDLASVETAANRATISGNLVS